MASIGTIFTSTYHTKQLNPWSNSSASRVVNYGQLPACQRKMEPFEEHPSTHWCLTSLRNKPQKSNLSSLRISVPIPGWIVIYCVQPLFDGKKCVLLLCVWKPAFLRSGYNNVKPLHALLSSHVQYTWKGLGRKVENEMCENKTFALALPTPHKRLCSSI